MIIKNINSFVNLRNISKIIILEVWYFFYFILILISNLEFIIDLILILIILKTKMIYDMSKNFYKFFCLYFNF